MLYGAAAAVASLGLLVVVGNLWVRNAPRSTGAVSDAPRQRYDGLFQAAFRTDGGRSEVTVDAVFEHAGLTAALAAYPQRGFTQGQTLDILTTRGANRTTLAFLVTVATAPNSTFSASTYQFTDHATLTDSSGRSYPVRGWSDVVVTAASTRSGVLTFDRSVDGKTPEESGATTLTLKLDGIPGGPRTYAWDLRVLGLTP